MKKFTKIELLRMIVKQKNNIDYMKNWNEKIEKNLVPKINPISQITNRKFREWDFEKSEKIIEKCVTLIKDGSYKEIDKPIYKLGSYCKNGYRFFFEAKYLSGYCIEEKIIKKVKLSQPFKQSKRIINHNNSKI